MENNSERSSNSYYRLTSVLIYFCMVYGILIGLIFTFGVRKRTINNQVAYQTSQNTLLNRLSADAQKELENNGIFVESVKPYETVASPVNVSGVVTKSVFPNNTFSAILVDNTGNILSISQVETEDKGSVASFKTMLEFEGATHEEGKIFFEDVQEAEDGSTKINSYKMPIKFALYDNADTEDTQDEGVAGASDQQ